GGMRSVSPPPARSRPRPRPSGRDLGSPGHRAESGGPAGRVCARPTRSRRRRATAPPERPIARTPRPATCLSARPRQLTSAPRSAGHRVAGEAGGWLVVLHSFLLWLVAVGLGQLASGSGWGYPAAVRVCRAGSAGARIGLGTGSLGWFLPSGSAAAMPV